MTRSKLSTKAVLLVGAIGLSTAVFAGSQPAAAQSYTDGYVCPVGSVQNTTYGCTSPDDANDYGYMPDYDYGYLPYGGYGHQRDGRHEFGHGFAHGMGASVNHGAGVTVLRGSPSQGLARLGDGFNHAMAGGISNVDHGPGFAHFTGGGLRHGVGGGFNRGAGFAHFGGGGFSHGMAGGFHGDGFGSGGHR
jgi:hypothetical protein